MRKRGKRCKGEEHDTGLDRGAEFRSRKKGELEKRSGARSVEAAGWKERTGERSESSRPPSWPGSLEV